MLEAGFYQAKVIDWAFEQNKNKNWQVTLSCRLLSYAAAPRDTYEPLDKNYKRTVFETITDKTKQRVLADLRAIGYPHDKPLLSGLLDPTKPDAVDFSKCDDLVLECAHETWDDKKSPTPKDVERWTIYRRGAAAAPVLREDADQFDQQFGADVNP